MRLNLHFDKWIGSNLVDEEEMPRGKMVNRSLTWAFDPVSTSAKLAAGLGILPNTMSEAIHFMISPLFRIVAADGKTEPQWDFGHHMETAFGVGWKELAM